MPKPEPNLQIKLLYHQAFEQYGTLALWNMEAVEEPTAADVLAITRALRAHGHMAGRRLAERIEALCRATHQCADDRASIPAAESKQDSFTTKTQRHEDLVD